MKNRCVCLLICVALLPAVACAQLMDADMDAGIIRFESQMPTDISSALPLRDGSLLVSVCEGDSWLGGPASPETAQKTTLLRLSAEGGVLWKKTLSAKRGAIVLSWLCEAGDGSVLGLARHSIDQREQYKQLLRFSVQDGSVIWSGDEMEAQEEVSERAYPAGQGYLWETILDSRRSTEPRYYELRAADGTPRWKVDQTQSVSVLAAVVATPEGTLLLGKAWAKDIEDDRACAALVDDAGKVVWKKDYRELGSSFFRCGAVSPRGELAAIALVGKVGETRKYALVTLAADSGELHRSAFASEGIDQPWIISSGAGWLLSGGGGKELAPALRFIQTDMEGNELQAWDMLLDADTLYGTRVFAWNGELWADLLIGKGDVRSALLRRVQ